MLFVNRDELLRNIDRALDNVTQHARVLEFDSWNLMFTKLDDRFDDAVLETDVEEVNPKGES